MAKVGPHISDKTAWREAHEGRTGSGDAAVLVLGKHFGRTPMTLFLEALGLQEREDLDGVESIRLGNTLEPAVASCFFNETMREVKPCGEVWLADHPRMCATPDYWQRREARTDKFDGILECKTSGSVAAWDESGEVPRAYWIQVQHQLAVTGMAYGSVAVLGGSPGGMAFRWKDVERDQAFIERTLIPAVEAFWECVETKTPPPPDSTTEYAKGLLKLYPEDTGISVPLAADFVNLDQELLRLKSEAAGLEDRITEIENQIRAAIGEATTGLLPNGVSWTWKLQTRKESTVKASSFRVLRRKEA